MRLNEIRFASQPPIDSYGPGGFRIGGAWHEGSLRVLPGGVAAIATPLEATALQPVLAEAAAIDVLLLGQGAEIRPLARPLRALLEEAGIGVEVMATPSACRTYNILLAEERRVGAILTAL